ncbi:MAG TPA: isochorismatase, partial [Opitutae bacterium]|nr:isochorismatase [Opitutae bacterium]
EAHVLPSETIFYSLLGSAEHPQFKAFTQLVKNA